MDRTNAERKRRWRSRHAVANSATNVEYQRRWRSAHPLEKREQRRASQARRYRDPDYRSRLDAASIARHRAITGTQVVPIVREVVAERDGWKCGICGGTVTRADWSIDHVNPLSRGGAHIYENVQLAHVLCNSRKGARVPCDTPPPT